MHRIPSLRPTVAGIAVPAAWLLLVVVSALAWYETGRGLAFRLGLGEVATAAGLVAGAVVVTVLLAWARGDVEERALADLRCPTCHGALAMHHEHAQAAMPGRQVWSCAACGFGKVAPLTCPGCAT